MQAYDVTLKRLFRSSAPRTLEQLTGTIIRKWLPGELPQVHNLRMDLFGEAPDGTLIQIELQSTNDPRIPKRMLNYCAAVYDMYDRIPRQIVLYAGEAPVNMPCEIRAHKVVVGYDLVDVRSLDAERLLQSDGLGDNVIAILGRLGDDKEAVRKIISRIVERAGSERQEALEELLVLAGLRRRLASFVQQEAHNMPLEINILDNEVLGPVFKRGREEGRQEGRQEGELAILRRQIEKRFGPLPGWADAWLAGRSTAELEALSLRLLDARHLEELLK
jgi:predicted transposase YdaD